MVSVEGWSGEVGGAYQGSLWCFVETTNELVNTEFTATACGPIKAGDGADDGNMSVSVCECVWWRGGRRGGGVK